MASEKLFDSKNQDKKNPRAVAFGKLVRKYRIWYDYTAEELADILGVKKGTISTMEHGGWAPQKESILRQLSITLHIPYEELHALSDGIPKIVYEMYYQDPSEFMRVINTYFKPKSTSITKRNRIHQAPPVKDLEMA